MPIWVDADALPVAMRDMLFRAAQRTGVQLVLVANRPLPKPSLPNIQVIQVEHGFDVADNLIAQRAQAGDLVITQDIPLAAEVMAKGAAAISPRGEVYSSDTIRSRLNIRDFMDTMRSSAMAPTGGPPPLGTKEKQAFANALDRWLAQQPRP
ncbi:MAG: YaiI/YqxD family protein [Gammaproteobacteria bacterium]|nr:MAG: YaiI/YqxD family protein [Gammaproteobacteria bacterium]